MNEKCTVPCTPKEEKLLRDENWVFSMTPDAKGTDMKLVSVKGRYRKGNRYLPFDGLPIPTVGVLEVTLDLTTDTDSRDAIDKDLFPLTTDEQKKYTFELLGERTIRGRQAYDIQFHPMNKRDFGWVGEALIDEEEFQPISVHTQLSRKLPLAVRTALGTNVHGLGYNIEYTRVDKDIWFPSSYGTEYDLHVLFLYDRTITESVENLKFHRVNVESSIEYLPPAEAQ